MAKPDRNKQVGQNMDLCSVCPPAVSGECFAWINWVLLFVVFALKVTSHIVFYLLRTTDNNFRYYSRIMLCYITASLIKARLCI